MNSPTQLEGDTSAPRRPSRSIAPVNLPGTNDVGFGAANMPLTNRFFSEGERMAEELGQSLSALGGITARVGAYARQDAEEAAAMDEKARKHLELIQEGQAVEIARRNLAGHAERIKSGQTPSPLNDASVPDFTDGIIRSDTEGMTDFQKKAYAKAIAPALDRLAYGLVDQNRQIVKEETTQFANAAASKETTPEGINAVLTKMRESGVPFTDDEVYGVALNVAQTAAMGGDTAKFDAASKVLGGRFPDQIQRAQNNLDVQQNKVRIETDRAFNNLAAGMDVDNKPFSEQRKILKDFAATHADTLDKTSLRSQLDRIDAAERNFAETERKRVAPIIHEQAKSSAVLSALPALTNGRLSGYGFASLRDTTIPNKEGTGTQVFTAKQQAEGSRDLVFAQIDAAFPKDPTMNLGAKLSWLEGSGDPDLRYEQFSHQLQGGAMMLSPTMTEKDVPRAAVDGFRAWRTGVGINRPLTNAHMDADTRHFYEIADIVQTNRGLSVEAALVAARAEGDRPPRDRAEPISTDLALKTLHGLGLTNKDGTPVNFAEIKNGGSMVETIRTLTLVNQAMGPMTPLDAATLAGQQFKDGWTNMGGYFVDRRARTVVDQIDKEAVSGLIAEYFVSQHPNEGPEAVKNLGLKPDDTGWSVAYLSPSWQSPIDAPRYSDHDLAEINYILQNQKTIADFPKTSNDYLRVAKSEITGGVGGAFVRATTRAGRGIFGTPSNAAAQLEANLSKQDALAAAIQPLDKPAEFRPNNPKLIPLYEFIKAKGVKAAPKPQTMPAVGQRAFGT